MTLVIYDVPDDRLRTKVADICQDFGLVRVQYSAFMGQMTRARQNELLARVRRRAANRPANIQMFQFCDKDNRARRVVSINGYSV